MSKLRNISTNSSFTSIRYAPLSKERSDANKREKGQIPVIDLEALRAIKRIVESIRERIDEAERSRTGNDRESCCTGDSSGPETHRSNCSENPDREKEEKR